MLLFLAALTTAAGGALFVRVLGADGWGPIDFLLLVLFLICITGSVWGSGRRHSAWCRIY